MMITTIDTRLYVIIGIVTTVIAQISLKRAGGEQQFVPGWYVWLFLSAVFYAMSFVSYYFSLRYYDISTVQPITMVCIVAMITLYGFFTGESFSYYKFAGIIVSVLSIYLISKT